MAMSHSVQSIVELNEEVQKFHTQRRAAKEARFQVVMRIGTRLMLAGCLLHAFARIPSRKVSIVILDASFILGMGVAVVVACLQPAIDWNHCFRRRPVICRLMWLLVIVSFSIEKSRQPFVGVVVGIDDLGPANIGFALPICIAAWGLVTGKDCCGMSARCPSMTALLSAWCGSLRLSQVLWCALQGGGCRLFDMSILITLPAFFFLLVAIARCYSGRNCTESEWDDHPWLWPCRSILFWFTYNHTAAGAIDIVTVLIKLAAPECMADDPRPWSYISVHAANTLLPHLCLLTFGTKRMHAFLTQQISGSFKHTQRLVGSVMRTGTCSTFMMVLKQVELAVGYTVFSYINGTLARLLSVLGVVIMSTCPPAEANIDSFFSQRPIMGACVALAFSAYCTLLGLQYQIYLYAAPALVMLQLFLSIRCHTRLCPQAILQPSHALCLASSGKVLADAAYLMRHGSPCLQFDFAMGIGFICATLMLAGMLLCCCCSSFPVQRLKAVPPTLCFYVCLYTQVTLWGVQRIGSGSLELTVCASFAQRRSDAVATLVQGIADVSPILLLLLVGRKRVFSFTAQRFDRDWARQDGAFLATLLDSASRMQVGDVFWIHHGRDDDMYPLFDARRNWRLGTVVSVNTDSFVVQTGPPHVKAGLRRSSTASTSSFSLRSLSSTRFAAGFLQGNMWSDVVGPAPSGSTLNSLRGVDSCDSEQVEHHELPMAAREMTVEDMMVLAQKRLRCIDWRDISRDLMSSSKCEADDALHTLSRPLRPGEVIDYFMSHSWHDDVDLKWGKLEEVAVDFERRQGRSPTFWLDKVCIDQRHIADGLKVLPVNVMACRQVLVLCGDTYPDRLWCIWELCVVFSFTSPEEAVKRLRFEVLGSKSNSDVLEFQAKNARCYDPNEQARLFQVISTIGMDRFDAQIRQLADAIQLKLRSSWSLHTAAAALASLGSASSSVPSSQPKASMVGAASSTSLGVASEETAVDAFDDSDSVLVSV
eukprot:TRINITY_DN47462_c0_g1_i1.p1 TRINITY_DN47462_c0_g1~~TRINITY_DN47462_c0_g1_i1.p1  ORF type:complete len:990 (-),score=78.16 TRINITY_DN47462_c0_g1_i1:56-3025(-)